ncbi:metallophosphoesterase family protein [Ligilactobacillus salivarius]|uniref:metallophosphoesterase family protein n=1 Tax=Ligilactobacillus salivarius TaxID=1624 RepID=UPI000665834D|nr:metallophosphoesterase family protein [Ligilactobacillus salivarius]
MKYFTADTHFFHKELIHDTRFANRMFFSVNDMNNTIVENWNSVVNDNDTVYHLGDIALINSKKEDLKRVLEILKKLKGQIVFLKGNHDSRALFKFIDKNNVILPDGRMKFTFIDVGLILKLNHYQLFLTHYPLLVGSSKNRVNVHGHIHHSSVNSPWNINVGVDSADIDYLINKLPFGTPISKKNLFKIIEAKLIDHKKRW